ncbi:2,3-diphosphoglycerate-dependent phosphoglycerate mutase [Arthrobacter bambusae]|nr:2,3-diphosphoglycerate-dependent phosphoglycerate mutase [Arthrobacter bambusae]
MADYGDDKCFTRGTLILLRHGSTEWNEKNWFTGWADVPLSARGIEEARLAGRLIASARIVPDVAYTSRLTRTIQTATIALAAADCKRIEIHQSWRLNERHYGALQGRDRDAALVEYGHDLLQLWRRSYNGTPPEANGDDTAAERVLPDEPGVPLPRAESLKDVSVRLLPYWKEVVEQQLRRGRTVLVVAHSNSLRAIVKHLEQISDEDIIDLNIPIAIPLVYVFGREFHGMTGRYLADASLS